MQVRILGGQFALRSRGEKRRKRLQEGWLKRCYERADAMTYPKYYCNRLRFRWEVQFLVLFLCPNLPEFHRDPMLVFNGVHIMVYASIFIFISLCKYLLFQYMYCIQYTYVCACLFIIKYVHKFNIYVLCDATRCNIDPFKTDL